MKTRFIYTIVATLILSTCISAQFKIKIPKIKIPKVAATTPQESTGQETKRPMTNASPIVGNTTAAPTASYSPRQMVMDDGYTFFTAKPVKGRNPKNSGDIDIGWYLVPKLRLMGTFPDNSGFRLIVKQNGKELSKFFCSGEVYRKKDDRRITPGKTVNTSFDDFMRDGACSNKEMAIEQLGMMDVEVFYVDGDTDEAKLVRSHKIDVHKVAQIKGYKGSAYPGVAEYFIQRYAEAAAGIIHTGGGQYINSSGWPFSTPAFSASSAGIKLELLIPFVPDTRTYYKTIIRCSVNGKRIALERDEIQLDRTNGSGNFVESALMLRNDPKYSERITFSFLKANLPLTLGGPDQNTNISRNPGAWECAFMEKGETYRTIRFEVGSDGMIVPHPEQKNGNINLYHKAFLIDVEIPEGGSAIDERSLPMPDAGIFYGIPWSTPEGKAAAARIPKKGTPYPVMPK